MSQKIHIMRRARAVILALLVLALMSGGLCVFADDSASGAPVLAKPSGDYLEYDVHVDPPTDTSVNVYCYETIKTFDYTIQAGDQLEYDYYVAASIPGTGAVDGDLSNGTLRDNKDVLDTNGFDTHPNTDITSLGVGIWVHRVENIAVTADTATDPKNVTVGESLKDIMLAVDTAPANLTTPCDLQILYDNIVITNNGQVVNTIFANSSDVDPTTFVTMNTPTASGSVTVKQMSDADAQAAIDQQTTTILTTAPASATNLSTAAAASDTGSNNTLLIVIIIIIVVVVIVVIIVVVVLTSKKKK